MAEVGGKVKVRRGRGDLSWAGKPPRGAWRRLSAAGAVALRSGARRRQRPLGGSARGEAETNGAGESAEYENNGERGSGENVAQSAEYEKMGRALRWKHQVVSRI